MRLSEEDVRRAVRAEAAVHRPDRTAMLDRLSRTTMRSPVPPRRSARLRMAGAAVAVAAVLGGGGVARWTLAGDGAVHPAPTATSVAPAPTASVRPPMTTPSPSAATSSSPAGRQPSRPAGRPPATTSRPTSTDPADPGPLRAAGVVDPDPGGSQGADVVRLTTTQRLDALEVTIRVARTPELASRGGSRQVPGASVDTTVTEEPDALIYHFSLSSADRLAPGTYAFSARYRHAQGGRDASGDSYRIAATTATGAPLTVSGRFG